ncbi:helix-turn-helix domain-containing protein [Cellulomonas sp. 179-A 4D5 NHS]|uniref:helix-turn-helix domain-containing protein n=1 Tax=Cellulomonas sp. 179-A 4D5 NHS TaxID=3142378 RepID=UPI0039A37844
MSTDFRVRVEIAARQAPPEPALAELGEALLSTGHTALGWVELHLAVTAADYAAAVLEALERVEPVAGARVLAVEVLTREEFAARAGIVPSPTTLGVPAAAELMGITEQAVRHKLRTGRLAGRREGRDWRIQRAEIDRARAARDAAAGGSS